MGEKKPQLKKTRNSKLPPDEIFRSCGHPTDYKPEYCRKVIEYGKRGDSLTAFAADIGVHVTTVRNWADTHKEFFAAMHISKQLACKWFEENMKSQLLTPVKGWPVAAWRYAMACRFREYGYTTDDVDKKNPNSPNAQDINEALAQLKELLKEKV